MNLFIQIGAIAAIIVLLALLLGLGVWAFTLLSDAIKSPAWPTIDGTVTSSKLVANRNANGLPGHHYRVRYEFNVGKRECLGDDVRYGSFRYQTQSMAQTTVQSYPVGQTVRVFYDLYFDPKDPANDELEPRSVLEPGVSYELIYPLALFFFTLGLIGWLVRFLVAN